MSTLTVLWTVPSFRAAARTLVDVSVGNEADLGASLLDLGGTDQPSGPPGVTPSDWQNSVRALYSLYRLASDEGLEDVVADLRDALAKEGDLDASAVSGATDRLRRLLARDEEVELRRVVEQARDEMMPLLLKLSLALDVRVVPRGQGETQLVPIVLARQDFDEHVGGGQDTLAFQLPLLSLPELAAQIADLQERLKQLVNETDADRMPDWSLPEWARRSVGGADER